jgi:hypothetical protein
MPRIYSSMTGGFYPVDMRLIYQAAGTWPVDGVEVGDEDCAALFAAQSLGKLIAPDENGYPVAIDPPVASVVPASVSPAQARLALLGAGLLDQVEAIVSGADQVTQIAWRTASTIERSSPTVAALSAALGLGEAQLDALFTTAAGIRV